MGIMVYFLLGVMQGLYHQLHYCYFRKFGTGRNFGGLYTNGGA